jgi:hypothetical protein
MMTALWDVTKHVETATESSNVILYVDTMNLAMQYKPSLFSS